MTVGYYIFTQAPTCKLKKWRYWKYIIMKRVHTDTTWVYFHSFAISSREFSWSSIFESKHLHRLFSQVCVKWTGNARQVLAVLPPAMNEYIYYFPVSLVLLLLMFFHYLKKFNGLLCQIFKISQVNNPFIFDILLFLYNLCLGTNKP